MMDTTTILLLVAVIAANIGGSMGVCADLEFECSDDGSCITKEAYCDGQPDCSNGSDEPQQCSCVDLVNGTACSDEYSRGCVTNARLCDGEDDCANWEDEIDCPCDESQFERYKCARGPCIFAFQHCNKISDCPDESDEGDDCTQTTTEVFTTVEPTTATTTTSTTTTTTTTQPPTTPPYVDPCTVDRGGCDQYCESSPGEGVTCICSESFVLSATDNKTCTDPCEEENGGCSQLCTVHNHEVVCGCFDGYTVNTNTMQCIDRNECVGVQCRNGAACVDLLNRYFCICTDDWRGQSCADQVVNDPVLLSITPDKGPVAGGTRMTMTGEHLINGTLLTLGQRLQCVYDYDASNASVAILITPSVRAEEANEQLAITVQFPGYAAMQTTFTFTYRDNPKLQAVKPLKGNVIGGTSLTVTGEDLDVVANPRLEVTMVHTYIQQGAMLTTTTLYYNYCDVGSTIVMKCLTPNVTVPPAFNDWDTDGLQDVQKRSLDSLILRRSARAIQDQADFTIFAENEALDFYLGFQLDGVKTYKNLSDTRDLIDYAKFTYVTQEPVVSAATFEPFIPGSGMTIRIKGVGLLVGFEASDYRVAIGSVWCNNLDVTDNEITCSPPDQLSPQDINARRRKRQLDYNDGIDLSHIGGRERRAVRDVVVNVIIHAGANYMLYAGTITYRITVTTTTTTTTTRQPTTSTTTTSMIPLESRVNDSDDNKIRVTIAASVVGVLALIALASAIGVLLVRQLRRRRADRLMPGSKALVPYNQHKNKARQQMTGQQAQHQQHTNNVQYPQPAGQNFQTPIFLAYPQAANAQTANAYPQTANAYPQAANAYPHATNAYPQATNAYPQATNTYPQASNAYPQATNVYPQASNAYPQASNAYLQATNMLAQSSNQNPMSSSNPYPAWYPPYSSDPYYYNYNPYMYSGYANGNTSYQPNMYYNQFASMYPGFGASPYFGFEPPYHGRGAGGYDAAGRGLDRSRQRHGRRHVHRY